MANSATFNLIFDASVKGAEAGFKALSNSAVKASQRIVASMNSIEKSVGQGLTKAIKMPLNALGSIASGTLKVLKGAVLGAGAAFVAAAYKGINAANDLNDAVAITNAAFGDNAKEMHEWAKESASAYGLARTQAEKYFGSIGEYMKNAGVDTANSATVAKNLAAKAGELSRAYGVSSDSAIQALTKGVQTGEGRALRQYGIILNEDVYNQELLAEGINKTYQELSAEDQILIRYNVMMNQLGDVTGATAGEFSTWEGAVAGLVSNTKDALASFGLILQHYLLPVVQLLAKIMQSVAGALSNLLGTLGIESGDTKAVEDYSGAIEDLGTSTENASKKAEKAGGGLASFDKINNLTNSKSSGSALKSAKQNVKAMNLLGNSAKGNIKPLKQWLEEFMNADWEGAGRNFGDKLNGLILKFNGFTDWLSTGELGTKVGEWLKGLTDSGVWGNATKSFVGLLTGIITTIGEIFKEAPMEDIGGQMIDGLVTGFQENEDKIGEELGNILRGIADFIIGFFNPDKMAQLGVSLGNIFNKLGEKGAQGEASAISKTAEAITTMILGIVSFITNFISTVDWGNLAKELLGGIGKAIQKNPEALFNGLALILTWNVAKSILGSAVDLFGKDMGTAAGNGFGLGFKITALALVKAFAEGAELKAQINETKKVFDSAAKEIASYESSAENIEYTGEITDKTETQLNQFSDKINHAWDNYHAAMAGFSHNAAGGIDLENNKNLMNMKAANEYLGDIVKAADEYGFKSEKIDEMANAYNSFKNLDLTYATEFAGHELWDITGSKKKDLQEGMSLLGEGGIAMEQFLSDMQKYMVSDNNPVTKFNNSLDGLVELSEKDVKPALDEDKKSFDDVDLSIDGVISNLAKINKENLPELRSQLDMCKEPLENFLTLAGQLVNLKWEGNLIDTDALKTNMDTAYKLVDDTVKKIDSAISESTNLKNFETVLSTTQTIKVDTSGKFGVTVDAKAHIDSSELESWYDEFTMGNKNSKGQ